MVYLVYEQDELVDVLDFGSEDEVNLYHHAHPDQRLDPSTDMLDKAVIFEEDDLEEDFGLFDDIDYSE